MEKQTNTRPPVRRGPMGGHGPMGGMPGQKPKNFKKTFSRLIQYLKPQKWSLIAVMVFSALGAVFTIIAPKVLAKATDSLYESITTNNTVDLSYIGKIILIVAVLYFVSAMFVFLSHFLASAFSQKVVYTLRREVKEKLDKLPLNYYDTTSNGEILSRVTNDMDTISSTLQQSVTQIITGFFTIVGILIMMFSISWLLTLITLLTLPLIMLVIKLIASRSQKMFKAQQEQLGHLTGHVEEIYGGHTIIKLFGREQKAIDEFEVYNRQLEQVGYKAQFLSGVIMPALNMINNIGYVAICVVGGIMVGQAHLTVGGIQAFIQYSSQFSQPIQQTAQIANVIQSTVAAAERVFEVLDEENEVPDTDQPIPADDIRGEVEFRHVDFSYLPDVPLIKDMNIRVREGDQIAIVGPTGAGKTTLVNLLMRFYEINGGEILIDGKNCKDFTKNDLRDQYGMVLQDTWLFSGTIRENIAYGKPDATMEEIEDAARKAHIDHYIHTLPDGYDTMLNEDASNISQGQKQLLTIARAILSDPKILILDEATSSVDTRTEAYIQTAMTGMMKGKTSFVIAHRLSTIKNAALILVMNKGTVVEQGTHAELLAQGGFYADLYNSQF